MSGHNWKPGDVAMVRCSDGHERRAISGKAMLDGSPVWVFRDGTRRDAERSIARPLVVIDPEDREQVERLTNALDQFITSGDNYADGAQAALREFAAPTPPRPNEPQGLGAVVEDSNGAKWVRAGHSYTDPNWRRAGGDDWTPFDQISAVRVLSEGVVL